MLALVFAPLYIALNIYMLRRLLSFLESCHRVFCRPELRVSLGAVCAFFALTPVLAFFLPPASQAKRVLQVIANYTLGIMLYAAMVTALGHLVSVLLRRLLKLVPKEFFKIRKHHILSGLMTLALIAGISGYGIIHASEIYLRSYSLETEKSIPGHSQLRIVLVADLHLGCGTGLHQMEKMAAIINAQKPDIVCIAGDIFDNDFSAIEQPERIAAILAGIKSTYGTYACWGNHDVDEKILAGFTFDTGGEKRHSPQMEDFLKSSNIRILEDETELVGGCFYITGRADGEKPGAEHRPQASPAELLEGLEPDIFSVVLYHEPRELQELSQAGCDLLLCGHTHDGQTFPLNLTSSLVWENSAGYMRLGDMDNIVTSGIGVWGPRIRVGTDAEVVLIDLRVQDSSAK